MPKSSKKTEGRKGRQLAQQAPQTDFTLAEFADAAPAVAATGRMKKATTKRWDKNVTEMCVKSQEGLAWFEKDLSDFELEVSETNEEEEESDDAVKKIKKKKPKTTEERYTGGVDYPYDVWCLIGDYISPECVAKFAAICKTAHTVVHTPRFWTKLYQRYHIEDCGLPEELKPQYMEKAHGLKSRVVRSLYYLHTPLVARVHSAGPFADDPDILLGSRCTLMWYQQFKGYWRFYFKFQASRPKATCAVASEHSNGTHKHLRRFLPQLDYNPEQNNSVLQVTTTHFSALPVIMGLQLVKTSIGLGHAMRYHKIKLLFAPVSLVNSCGGGQTCLSSSAALVIDQVASIRVLQWWDPKYPYKNSLNAT